MPDIFVTTRSGDEIIVEAAEGFSVMEAIRDAGIDELMALCGGACSCATCHVYLDKAFEPCLPLRSEDEDELLDGSEHKRENSRLSCQLMMNADLNGLRVTIAPEN